MSCPKTDFSALSYRDRDGFIAIENNIARRYILHSYAENYNHLMSSGLYTHLVEETLLIPHQEISSKEYPAFYKVIDPEYIPFITYPYEWTFDQWKEVALKTLQINSIAVQYGMILKDATVFNFTWHKGQSIFIDTLSFEKYQTGSAWTGYLQFCQNILGPLSLICYCDAQWARLFQSAINGWELPFISKTLPNRTWLNKTLFLHIHLHSKTSSQQSGKGFKTNMTTEKLLALWSLLEKGIETLKVDSSSRNWSTYYTESIISQQYLEEKTIIVEDWLRKLGSYRLIDLGANTGKFSLIAANYFEQVISLESDIDCIKQIQNQIRSKSIKNLVTVWADLTQPSAGLGWNNEERTALISRLRSDCLVALALIHHLCITKNIRLEMLSQLFSTLTNKWAIVEFIPKDDPKIITMLENRKDVFVDYTEARFIESFQHHFHLIEIVPLKHSLRKLYLWERK